MVRRHIPKAVKETLVTMSGHMLASEIETVTGITKRTVNRVLKLHQETGHVVRVPLERGRPRKLNALHIAVSHTLQDFWCDLI
jgi:transposase